MHESADARPARAVAAARRRPRRGHRGSVAFLPAARRSCITLRTRCVAQPPTSRGLCVRNRTARRLSSSTASRFAGSAPQARTLLLRCADSLSRRGGVPPGGRRSGMPPTRGGGGGHLGAAEGERRSQNGAALGGQSCPRMRRSVSYAKRFWQRRTKGKSATATGCAGRLTAQTSYLQRTAPSARPQRPRDRSGAGDLRRRQADGC